METKRGRPRKRTVDKRVVQVTLRLTLSEYSRLKTAARNKNIPVSKLIRGYLDEFFDI